MVKDFCVSVAAKLKDIVDTDSIGPCGTVRESDAVLKIVPLYPETVKV